MTLKKKPDRPFIHKTALVESGSRIGARSRVWAFAHVLPGAVIGRDCNIGDHCFIESAARIGDRVTVKNGVSIWDAVTLEDDVFIGPNATFTNDLRPVSRQRFPFVPTRVQKGACIGANATVVCGHSVGRFSLIGAGSVVTDDVPDHALAYGNPARVRSWICFCRRTLKFSKGKAVCKGCHSRFSRSAHGVKPLR